jgi:hypothetical protein
MSGKYTWPQDQIDRWFFDTDYAVVYVHQWQRRTPELMLKYLATQVPEHSVWIDGIEYARIYKMSSYLDFYDAPTYRTLDISLGDQIRLEGYNLAQRQFAPGDELRIASPGRRCVSLMSATRSRTSVGRFGEAGAQSDFEPWAVIVPPMPGAGRSDARSSPSLTAAGFTAGDLHALGRHV